MSRLGAGEEAVPTHPDPPRPTPTQEAQMATGEAGFDDVSFDLISAQYHSLKAGHD